MKIPIEINLCKKKFFSLSFKYANTRHYSPKKQVTDVALVEQQTVKLTVNFEYTSHIAKVMIK